MKVWQKAILLCLLLCAAFLRFYAPLNYPLEINQDELNNIYDARSFAETGKDRWETPNPFILRGLGNEDYRPALQAWTIAPVYMVFGYSIATGRMVSAFIGMMSLLLLFLFLRNGFNDLIAFMALLLAVISPVHIMYSRIAHEGGILPIFFTILILYLWQKARNTNYVTVWLLITLSFCVGFSANAYQSSKVSGLVLSIALLTDIFINSKQKVKSITIFIVCCFIGAFPQIYTLLNNTKEFFSRAQSQTISFKDPVFIKDIIINIYNNLSPQYLFMSNGVYNNLSLARLIPVELPFFYGGLLLCFYNHKKIVPYKFPLVLLLVAAFAVMLPACLTYSNPSALRASGFFILAPMFTAIGFCYFLHWIFDHGTKKGIVTAFTILLAGYMAWFINKYANSPELRNKSQQHTLVAMYKKLDTYKNAYTDFYIENTTGESYLYLLSYCNIPPVDFQKGIKKYEALNFDDFSQFNNFYFIKKDAIPLQADSIVKQGDMLVATFTPENFKKIDSISFLNDRFYFMEPVFPKTAQKLNN